MQNKLIRNKAKVKLLCKEASSKKSHNLKHSTQSTAQRRNQMKLMKSQTNQSHQIRSSTEMTLKVANAKILTPAVTLRRL